MLFRSLLFVLFSVLIATKFLLGEKGWRLGDELPGAAAMSGYGLVIGFYSAVMGVGGGSVDMVQYAGRPVVLWFWAPG